MTRKNVMQKEYLSIEQNEQDELKKCDKG